MKKLIPFLGLTLLTGSLSAQSIVGTWFTEGAGKSKSDAVLTFLPNGVYIMAEDGNRALDSTGRDGMERGTYEWNAATNAFSNKTLVDTTGRWGLSDESIKSVSVSGDTLKLGGVRFTRVKSYKNKLVGGWYLKEGEGYALIAFLADGTYFMAQDVKRTVDERTGVERGTYKWNSSTKVFTRKVIMDTNGGLGFSSDDKRTINVTDKLLILRVVGDDGSATLRKVGK